MSVHNDLRTVEAKLRKLDIYVPPTDPVWKAFDRLWEYVVLGPEATE
jgi:hypothetical protein